MTEAELDELALIFAEAALEALLAEAQADAVAEAEAAAA